MSLGRVRGRVGAGALVVVLVACGGESKRHVGDGGDGATGGAEPVTGGSGGSLSGGSGGSPAGGTSGAGTALVDCTTPIANGEPCHQEQALCGGVCVNSWQAVNVCIAGLWTYAHVSACGPKASTAPECHNSFEGGALTPCCPEGGLDCAGQPNNYPGFSCTPGDTSFCSCTCYDGVQACGC